MKRRHVIATVIMSFIPGCQLQSGLKKQENNKNEINIDIANNNDKNVVVDITIVKNGSLVYVDEISIQVKSQKALPQNWKGSTFAIVVSQHAHNNYEVIAIDDKDGGMNII